MTVPNISIGLQARLSSTRLPCKAMLSFGDTSLLGFLIYRCLLSGFDTYLLTSDQPEDDILECEALSANVTGVIRGSIDDVRSRYLSLSQKINCDFLVRVTGDNPFTDFRLIKPLIDYMARTDSGYAWLNPACCPDGINLEVFTTDLLRKSIVNSNSPQDLEHVTPWMKSYLTGNGLWLDSYPEGSSDYHLGIDTIDDYVKILTLLQGRLHDSRFLRSPEMLDWLISSMVKSHNFPRCRRHAL